MSTPIAAAKRRSDHIKRVASLRAPSRQLLVCSLGARSLLQPGGPPQRLIRFVQQLARCFRRRRRPSPTRWRNRARCVAWGPCRAAPVPRSCSAYSPKHFSACRRRSGGRSGTCTSPRGPTGCAARRRLCATSASATTCPRCLLLGAGVGGGGVDCWGPCVQPATPNFASRGGRSPAAAAAAATGAAACLALLLPDDSPVAVRCRCLGCVPARSPQHCIWLPVEGGLPHAKNLLLRPEAAACFCFLALPYQTGRALQRLQIAPPAAAADPLRPQAAAVCR